VIRSGLWDAHQRLNFALPVFDSGFEEPLKPYGQTIGASIKPNRSERGNRSSASNWPLVGQSSALECLSGNTHSAPITVMLAATGDNTWVAGQLARLVSVYQAPIELMVSQGLKGQGLAQLLELAGFSLYHSGGKPFLPEEEEASDNHLSDAPEKASPTCQTVQSFDWHEHTLQQSLAHWAQEPPRLVVLALNAGQPLPGLAFKLMAQAPCPVLCLRPPQVPALPAATCRVLYGVMGEDPKLLPHAQTMLSLLSGNTLDITLASTTEVQYHRHPALVACMDLVALERVMQQESQRCLEPLAQLLLESPLIQVQALRKRRLSGEAHQALSQLAQSFQPDLIVAGQGEVASNQPWQLSASVAGLLWQTLRHSVLVLR
jgi:hypothetical protein